MKKLVTSLLVAIATSINVAQAAEKVYFINTDHLGSPSTLTDADQTVVWQSVEDPFGDGTPTTALQEHNFRFPGQYYDLETGLNYNWNRYYKVEVGKYISSDPIGLDGGLNTFLYSNANSLKYFDPKGLQSLGGFEGFEFRGPEEILASIMKDRVPRIPEVSCTIKCNTLGKVMCAGVGTAASEGGPKAVLAVNAACTAGHIVVCEHVCDNSVPNQCVDPVVIP